MTRWKKWWSYIMPVHIESIGSEYNDSLELYLINNRLRLTTLDAIYSYDDRYYNFYKTFSQTPLPGNGSEVLILGLGLGSIPYMLEKTFHQDYHFTAVELDEAVIYLFSKYQQSRLASSIEIVEADGADFMAIQSQTYDLICIDIFIGEVVPSHIKENAFIQNVKKALSPGGRVVWNMLYATEEQVQEVNEFIEFQFSAFFSDFQILEVLGNVILTNREWELNELKS